MYTAQVYCRQAGIVTLMGKLNGRIIGHPETLLIKANTACKLQVAMQDALSCIAGWTPFWMHVHLVTFHCRHVFWQECCS